MKKEEQGSSANIKLEKVQGNPADTGLKEEQGNSADTEFEAAQENLEDAELEEVKELLRKIKLKEAQVDAEEVFLGDIPSPEEAFGDLQPPETEEETVPIPEAVIKKKHSWGFLLALILLALAAVGMKYYHIQLYCMESDSMERVIPKGSLVVVKPIDPQDIQLNDVITYQRSDGKTVTHQVVVIENSSERNEPVFRTKGTENAIVDKQAVSSDQIKGIVYCYIPYLGKILTIFRR